MSTRKQISTRRQISISAGIVGAAAIVVAAVALKNSSAGASGQGAGGVMDDHGMGGHDHAAMMAAAGDELRPVRLDREGARRIGLTFAEVERGPLSRAVRVAGVVTVDETRLVDVSPRLEGWVEELYVDFTGAPVRRGEPLLSLYSPALVAAQEELILARRLADELAAAGGRAAENARELLEAARRRLAYWDIGADQIEAIERSGTPQRALVLHAPAGGLVVEKNLVRGSRVLPGTSLYRIADLSRVWVEGEVFEKDLGLVEIGRRVEVGVDAYPGQSLEGKVTYIHPTVSAESRTGRIRVELANPGLRLKPGMFANLAFDAPIHLAGLHIPRSAVLTTGSRSLVFVRAADGTLVPREVRVGGAAGEHVEILAGLEPGEVVVSSANFLVDAEANLGMSLEGMSGMNHDGAAGSHDANGGHGAAGGHADHGAPAAPSTHAGH